jgi:hypothetical protein
MTLKEKFKNIVCNVEISNEKLINKSEQIADDYAIDFAEWCMEIKNKLGYHEGKKEWYVWNLDRWLSTKELLEIFKKEKGL